MAASRARFAAQPLFRHAADAADAPLGTADGAHALAAPAAAARTSSGVPLDIGTAKRTRGSRGLAAARAVGRRAAGTGATPGRRCRAAGGGAAFVRAGERRCLRQRQEGASDAGAAEPEACCSRQAVLRRQHPNFRPGSAPAAIFGTATSAGTDALHASQPAPWPGGDRRRPELVGRPGERPDLGRGAGHAIWAAEQPLPIFSVEDCAVRALHRSPRPRPGGGLCSGADQHPRSSRPPAASAPSRSQGPLRPRNSFEERVLMRSCSERMTPNSLL